MEDNRKEEQEKRAEIRAILSFRDRSEKAMEDAVNPAACIGCGQCTSHCPQSIAVPEIMDKLSAWPVR